MDTQTNNPIVAPLLRVAYGITAIVVIAGASLFFFPDLMVPRWPWPLAPFNARFMGAIYLLELSALIIVLITNRWAPTRLVLPLSFVFSSVVTIVSLFYIGRFDFGKWATYVWFLLYGAAALLLGYYMWHYRNMKPADPTLAPPAWRGYFLAEGLVYGLYGAGLFVFPATFSSFWPWAIDDFHARVYGTVFMLLAVAMSVLLRAVAPIEFFTMGVTQVVWSFCSVLGLVIVDLSVHRVNWSSPGTWVWIGAFAVLFVSGVGMIGQALSLGLFRSSATVAVQ